MSVVEVDENPCTPYQLPIPPTRYPKLLFQMRYLKTTTGCGLSRLIMFSFGHCV